MKCLLLAAVLVGCGPDISDTMDDGLKPVELDQKVGIPPERVGQNVDVDPCFGCYRQVDAGVP